MIAKKKSIEKIKIKEKEVFIKPADESPSVKENKALQHVGHHFRKIRDRKHYSLEEVSEVLRIGGRYLAAIEEGNAELLPERVYALGFVRAYAQFLGENPTKCVELFKKQILLENKDLNLNLPEALRKSTAPNKLYLIVSIAIAFSVLLLWLLINSFSKEKQEALDLTPTNKTLLQPEKSDSPQTGVKNSSQESFADEAPLLPAAASVETNKINKPAEDLGLKMSHETSLETVVAPPPKEIVERSLERAPIVKSGMQNKNTNIKLMCIEETWVQIKEAQGNIIFVKTMLPGETFDVPQKEGLLLFIGNAGG
jgi:cytoskeleton protein RodZ